MYGCRSGSALVVNAELESMGGIIDGGVGSDTKTSPRTVAIEKAQAELRLEYDVREERKRELEFLEKGGNPLDFKFGHASSVSVQSTSLTDQNPEHLISEAKGNFAVTASPHGDSVESIGRPGVPTVSEPNTADNLLLFDGDNEAHDGEQNYQNPSRVTFAPSEQPVQRDRSRNAKSEESGMVRKNKAYARRNRSKTIRDSSRSIPASHGSSLSLRPGSKDNKILVVDTPFQKEHEKFPNCNTKSESPNGEVICKTISSDNQSGMELNGGFRKSEVSDGRSDSMALNDLQDKHVQPKIDGQQTATNLSGDVPDLCGGHEQEVPVDLDSVHPAAAVPTVTRTITGQLNGFREPRQDRKGVVSEGTKGLDYEFSCTHKKTSLDGNVHSDRCTNTKDDFNENTEEKAETVDTSAELEGGKMVEEEYEKKTPENEDFVNKCQSPGHDQSGNACTVKIEDDLQVSGLHPKSNAIHSEGMEVDDTIESKNYAVRLNLVHDSDDSKLEAEKSHTDRPQMDDVSTPCEPHEATLTERASVSGPEIKAPSKRHSKLAKKADEDSILEEARIIQAKRKRISELSVGALTYEIRRNCHWDFVIEEMSWLANDFVQERMWKMAAAAQISHRAAFASKLRYEKQALCQRRKSVAQSLAKAVMQFWHSAEMLLHRGSLADCLKDGKGGLCHQERADWNEVAKDMVADSSMEKNADVDQGQRGNYLSLERYAVRFLEANMVHAAAVSADAAVTPDNVTDFGMLEMTWDDHLTEANLFYAVPSGAVDTYRKSIEAHLVQSEKTNSSMQEEVETSTFDAGAEAGFQENMYEEDEGEMNTYHFSGASDRSKLFKTSQKKRKNMMKSYSGRSGDLEADMLYGHCMENKIGNPQSGLVGRSANNLNLGSIPTKRMRTAPRQRVLSPFGTGPSNSFQTHAKTDASSGDTNSLQDDQSTLQGGPQIHRGLEVDSMDFEKQERFECAEISKPKKRKKSKQLGLTYDQRWAVDSTGQSEQRDHLKRRLESHHLESNGNIGLPGQHAMKKPRAMKHSLDNSLDTGPIPSPVASQMSNMSNSNKFIKMIGGRDRGKKSKVLKNPSGHPGTGSPWSLFEDQALVVLVHDMGPNWELVSDCINNTLQLKCIFRKPKECKERHKILMDRTSGDGADSAEDSGSSQPYPSTLPGIPKGSARQLFQRLQGPMEEDTLKSHFEKIISIVQQQHYQKRQNEKQEPKQISQVHNSHIVALSQVSPNNLNGATLTPLELIDVATSSSEVASIGYHNANSGFTSQSPVGSTHPVSGVNSSQQGSSCMMLGGNVPSSSGPLSGSTRDAMYGVPRAASLPVDDQQRVQQYNHILSGRNIPQSSLPVPGTVSGADRGVRMLPGGNGMGMMCGMNRNMPISRPGLQGISSSVLNTGGMLTSSMMGVPSPVNMHPRAGSHQANSMLRPRDAMHMIRPGQNAEHQRQMMMPEIQMQVTQANNQGAPPFSGLSSAFPNQSIPSPVQNYGIHSPQQHQMSPQQSHVLSSPHHPHLQGPNHSTSTSQAYAMRFAKERQMQQRIMQQQQHQQLAVSNSLMPHVPPQSQIPISPPVPNTAQVQPQASSQPVSLAPQTPSSSMTSLSSQQQQKHHLPPHGLGRNPQTGPCGLPNHIMGKQRQRQQHHQFQQSSRHNSQQRQPSSSQKQTKLLKGIGRGNILSHQNLPVDPSHLNGLTPQGGQTAEKGDQVVHLIQGQGLYSGSSPVHSTKPLVTQSSNQSQPQQKLYSGGTSPLSKQLPHMPPLSDSRSQGQVSSVPSGHALSAAHQAAPTSVVGSNQQQLRPQAHPQIRPLQKQLSQSQSTVHRMLQQNRQANSDLSCKAQTDQAQADQQPAVSLSQVGVDAMAQACTDATDVVSAVSSGSSHQWDAPEPSQEAGFPTAYSGSCSSPPLTNSAGSEPVATVSQGSGQRQLSGNLSPHGRSTVAQWQQHPQLQHPSPPPPPTQQQQQQEQSQHQQSSQHLAALQNSQQPPQHLQAGQSSMYVRSANSRPE